jgi:anti-sigma-K factor RskA
VLGELSASDARKVEDMAARYPEVKEELRVIEESLEGVLRAAAVAPRPGLRDALFAKLDGDPPLDQVAPPVIPLQPAWQAQVQPPVPNIPPPATPYRWLAAASVAIALLSSVAAVYFWSRWQESENQLSSLVAQNSRMAQHVNTLENRNEGIEQALAVLTDPGYQTVAMQGLDPAPTAQAVVYWKAGNAEVFLNPGTLPQPPAGKQYQLWAIVDGKPVDAGVFDTGEPLALQRMKDISNASAFAVTLEPAGGSPAPTMDQMYVMGKAS